MQKHPIVAARGELVAGVIERDAIDEVRLLERLDRTVRGDAEPAGLFVDSGWW